jgi:hypothetical protein
MNAPGSERQHRTEHFCRLSSGIVSQRATDALRAANSSQILYEVIDFGDALRGSPTESAQHQVESA